MFCPKCGADNPDDAIFCKSCGTKFVKAEKVRVESGPSSSNYKQPNNNNSNNGGGAGTYIVCCCCCIIVLCIIGLLM